MPHFGDGQLADTIKDIIEAQWGRMDSDPNWGVYGDPVADVECKEISSERIDDGNT